MIPSGLSDNIIYQLAKVAKSFQDNMQHSFSAAGFQVTSEQFTILTHLWYRDGQSQKEIAASIDRDKTTVSRVLNTMIHGNLIKRVTGIDKRERHIYLTDHGKTIQDQLVQISGQLYFKAIDGINSQDMMTILRTLRSINKNLSK